MEDDLKKAVKSYIFLFVIAVVIVAADQWTKFLVYSNLSIGEVWSPWDWLTPYARIVHWYNTGVAFGLFQDANLLFAIMAMIVSVVIIYYFPRVPSDEWALRVALSMELGGAVGNLVDRLTIGHVTDFISVGTFPVFNIADSCITIGVAILLLGIWIQDRKDRRTLESEGLQEVHEDTSTQY